MTESSNKIVYTAVPNRFSKKAEFPLQNFKNGGEILGKMEGNFEKSSKFYSSKTTLHELIWSIFFL